MFCVYSLFFLLPNRISSLVDYPFLYCLIFLAMNLFVFVFFVITCFRIPCVYYTRRGTSRTWYILSKIAYQFFESGCTILHSLQKYVESSCSFISVTIVGIVWLFIVFILVDVKQVIVYLIWVSLMSNDIEHLLMYLLAIQVSSVVFCQFYLDHLLCIIEL